MPTLSIRRNFICLLALFFVIALGLSAGETATTFPLDQVRPGLKGVAYTIFTGDEVEKVDLVVLGVLHNALGPKQDVILVQLLGEKAEHSGVVAGMSGSPVYFDGKLAGALSLKLGVFTKEAIGGVTPIASILDIQNALPGLPGALPATPTSGGSTASAIRISIPADILQRAPFGAGNYLQPIETPLVSTGISPGGLGQFQRQFAALGM